MHRRHGQAGRAGQVLADLVGQAPRQEADQDRDREQQAEQRRDAARRAPQQRAQGQAEQPGHGQVQRAADHRAGHSGRTKRHRQVLAAHDGLAGQEHRDRGRDAHREHRGGQHGRLAPQGGQPSRHRRQRGPDQAGGVLAGDQQHAEHPGRDLRELHPGQADRDRVERGDGRRPVRGSGHPQQAVQDAERDDQDHRGQQRPQRARLGAQLGPFRLHHPGLGYPQC